MPGKRYNSQELHDILSDVRSGYSISDVGSKFSRSVRGILRQLENEQKTNPSDWLGSKIIEYQREVSLDYHRKRVIDYLRENPNATKTDIRNTPFSWSLSIGFNGSLTRARKELYEENL